MNAKQIKKFIENSVVLFNYDPTGTNHHKGTFIVANGSYHECPVSNHIDKKIIDGHVANGGTFSNNIELHSFKKVVGKNGMGVYLVKIDGVVYEMYADFYCIPH